MVEVFGVWQEKSMMGKKFMGTVRTTFLVDEQGIISHIIKGKGVDTGNHAEQIWGWEKIMCETTKRKKGRNCTSWKKKKRTRTVKN